jgi:hypothetical protein
MECFSEHDTEFVGYIEGVDFLDQLSTYQLFRKQPVTIQFSNYTQGTGTQQRVFCMIRNMIILIVITPFRCKQ